MNISIDKIESILFDIQQEIFNFYFTQVINLKIYIRDLLLEMLER